VNRLRKTLEEVRSDPHLAWKQLNGPSPMGPLSKYISESQTAPIPDEIRELSKQHSLPEILPCSTVGRLTPHTCLGPT
jgi:hypothetical protein